MRSRLLLAIAAAAAAAAGLAGPAHSQTGSSSAEQIERELKERDAQIQELRKRIEALERERAEKRVPAPVERQVRKPTADEALEEEAVSRALERALVRSGGLLLRPGETEMEPGLTFDYTRRSSLAIVGTAIASQDLERNTVFTNLAFRFGLPWSSQLELNVPYGWQRVENVTAGVRMRASDNGVGDIQIGFSKQLYAERDGRSGLIANLTWQESKGDSSFATFANPGAVLNPNTSLGVGYDSLQGRLTWVQRHDPLVFVTSVSYAYNRDTDVAGLELDPSNTTGLSVRGILAASPRVSLRTGFGASRTGNTRVSGIEAEGSKQTLGILEFGSSFTLTRSTLLDVFLGIGVTQDSPDFLLGVSVPIRF